VVVVVVAEIVVIRLRDGIEDILKSGKRGSLLDLQ
jgi:hypothetical protein